MAIYTLGYAAPGSEQELTRLMTDPSALLVDIRLLPTSRWCPHWRKGALSTTYGPRYLHLRGLGNVNYKSRTRGIRLLAPEEPLLQLRHLMERGHSLVLLCACAKYEQCHRRTVYQLLLNT
jgi:uncharacterized protein (DUF488 family)